MGDMTNATTFLKGVRCKEIVVNTVIKRRVT